MRLVALDDITPKSAAFLQGPPIVPELWKPKNQYLCEIFSPAKLDKLIVYGGLNSDALSVTNFSRRAPAADYTMRRHAVEPAIANLCDPLSIAEYLQQGYSLHVSNLQRYDGDVLRFTDRLAFELGARVKADCFFTPRNAQAFAEHYDTNDNMICQLFGTKAWRLYRPAFASPLPRHPWQWADASDELRNRITSEPPDVEIILAPGSVLWIPRGWIHAGTATEEPSLHLTLRPEPVSLEWVAKRIIESITDTHPEMRSSLVYGSLITPELAMGEVPNVAQLLLKLLKSADAEAVGLDLWRSYSKLLTGPTVNPATDISVTKAFNASAFWFRPEGCVGYWRSNEELHVHLGTARRIFCGVKGDLIEGLIRAGDYVHLGSLSDKFGALINMDELTAELRVVGLAALESELPKHWISTISR